MTARVTRHRGDVAYAANDDLAVLPLEGLSRGELAERKPLHDVAGGVEVGGHRAHRVVGRAADRVHEAVPHRDGVLGMTSALGHADDHVLAGSAMIALGCVSPLLHAALRAAVEIEAVDEAVVAVVAARPGPHDRLGRACGVETVVIDVTIATDIAFGGDGKQIAVGRERDAAQLTLFVCDHACTKTLGDEVAIRREPPRTARGALLRGGAGELELRELRSPVVLERRRGVRLVLRAAGAPRSDDGCEKGRENETEAHPVGHHEARHLPDFVRSRGLLRRWAVRSGGERRRR